jgi:hypothetical protein
MPMNFYQSMKETVGHNVEKTPQLAILSIIGNWNPFIISIFSGS